MLAIVVDSMPNNLATCRDITIRSILGQIVVSIILNVYIGVVSCDMHCCGQFKVFVSSLRTEQTAYQ